MDATGIDIPATQERLVGALGHDGLARLRQARVCVLGLGGVGGAATLALARGGVGSIVVVDKDDVEPSNMNRQALAFAHTLGRPKATVARELVASINPQCEVDAHHAFVPADIAPFMEDLGQVDYVIDAIDTITQKLRLAAWAQETGVPLLSSMGGANKLDPTQLRFADINKTEGDRLSRIIRKECRKRRIRHLEVLYSPEPINLLNLPELPSREKSANLATCSWMPAIMGQMIAGRVICRLAGVGDDGATWLERHGSDGEA